jgi:RNA polymerase sigma factor (sigma-70 family)
MTVKTEPWTECPDGSVENVRFAGKHSAVGLFFIKFAGALYGDEYRMTDKEIIEGLIARDEKVTREFFFTSCRPLFISIINSVFSYRVDYDEFVNELYLYLIRDDAARLRTSQGKSSLFQWVKVVAIRYFIAKRDNLIEDRSEDALLKQADRIDYTDDRRQAHTDFNRILSRMQNRRYAYVLMRLVQMDDEPEEVAKSMGITVANLYNIKKRALASFAEEAVNDVKEYGKH